MTFDTAIKFTGYTNNFNRTSSILEGKYDFLGNCRKIFIDLFDKPYE